MKKNMLLIYICKVVGSLLILGILFSPTDIFSAEQKSTNWLDDPVTIRFHDEPLNKILVEISKQTGIAILYDQKLSNKEISCNYTNVKVSEAITRLFTGKNKTIQVDQEKKNIIVKTFGAKDFVWSDSNNRGQGIGQDVIPTTLGDLEKMHSQQYKKYKERITDDNEIQVGGMTRREIRTMHEQQSNKYQEQLADDSEILSVGVTRKESRTIHEGQYKDYQARITNNSEKVEGNVTRGEIKINHEQQYEAYRLRMESGNEINEGGMTSNEIRSMLDKQSREYKKGIK